MPQPLSTFCLAALTALSFLAGPAPVQASPLQAAARPVAASKGQTAPAAAQTADTAVQPVSPAPSEETPAAPAAQPASVTPAAPAPQPAEDPVTTVTISAAGDCTLGTEESFGYEATFPAAWDAAGGDGSVFLAGVQSVFAKDDLTVVNLEGPLTTRGQRQDKTFAFRGDPAYVEVLKAGSVEAASLANNHS